MGEKPRRTGLLERAAQAFDLPADALKIALAALLTVQLDRRLPRDFV